MKTIITKMSMICLIVLMMASCKKDPEMPGEIVKNIKTNEVTDVTAVSAVVSAYVDADCDERGVCWSESDSPTIDDFYVSNEKGKGDYTCLLTNLTPNKKYYCKAYGKCGTKYVYSQQTKNFTTKDGLPTIVTGIVSDITATSAKCNGEVTDGGGLDVTDKGLCWAKHSSPTTSDMKVSKGSGLGEFTVEMTDLEIGERYYVRAYSVNTKETKYGNEREFTTQDGIAVVTTSSVTNIMATTATCGGEVTDDGGFAVTERGVCWSKSTNPTVEGSHKTGGSGNGSFTVGIDNLEMDETYHVRAYAKNSHTTSYGDDVVFSTKDGITVVTTSFVTNIMTATATCGGNVTDDGGFPVTARGVCWSTSQNPTVAGNHTTDGGGTGTFTSELTGLAENTTYYVRAYATNSYGTGYGEQMSFTTLSQSQTFTVNGVTFEMILVEGGTFTMGGTSEQGSDAGSNEFPTHSVTLSNYYIGEFEVTQELWEAVMGSNPSYFNGSNLPVEQVSWNDCQEFVTKLNGLTGKNFRLPTEAEWEYAARGGNRSGGYKYSGGNNINDVAWYSDNSDFKTHAVGTKSPNELGIYDMSGNVFEWCQDWYGDYSSDSQTNPQGPSSGSRRVNRGGSWYDGALRCRVSDRGGITPDSRCNGLGFRLVVSQ